MPYRRHLPDLAPQVLHLHAGTELLGVTLELEEFQDVLAGDSLKYTFHKHYKLLWQH